MKRFKNIAKWIVNALTIILLIILVLVIYGKCVVTFSDNTFPNYFGYTLFEVASGSMKPTLAVNDVIIVKIENDNLKKKDIIAYLTDNSIITHRIVFIDDNVITTKGDNNNTIDEPITKNQVVGRVVKIIPKLGVWKKVFTEPKILGVLFITLLLFDFALSYKGSPKDLIKELKNDNEEEKNKKFDDKKLEQIIAKKLEKDIVKEKDLLDVTRVINISEINDLIENKEINCKKINNLKVNSSVFNQIIAPELKKKKKNAMSEYTLRLDLSGIQRKIDSSVR